MSVRSPDLTRVQPACRMFAEVVEELLSARRAAREAQPFEYTREELCDLAYSSYKALLRGVLTHPPRRAVVGEVAEYLACTLAERNRLLLAAGYSPEQPRLEGPAEVQAVAQARDVMRALPFPALVLRSDWRIQDVNDALLTLFDFDRSAYGALEEAERHLLRLTFDPHLPLRERLGGDTPDWRTTARRDLLAFRRATAASQHEDWFRALVASLSPLPDFTELWAETGMDGPPDPSHALHVVPFRLPDGTRVEVQLLTVLIGDLTDPRVLAFAPLSRETSG